MEKVGQAHGHHTHTGDVEYLHRILPASPLVVVPDLPGGMRYFF